MPKHLPPFLRGVITSDGSERRQALIARILGDERYYGDGRPTWPDVPSADKASRERLRVIKRLRRFSVDFEGATELAARLEACQPALPLHKWGVPGVRTSVSTLVRG